jgi:hypothetical protein
LKSRNEPSLLETSFLPDFFSVLTFGMITHTDVRNW